ncbi:MAG: hypothetical protein LQ342_005927 [Letrouitia transgressa]|nr:MAG: hypothetical protein LQ342_005927 [Letrouitia transgressa]
MNGWDNIDYGATTGAAENWNTGAAAGDWNTGENVDENAFTSSANGGAAFNDGFTSDADGLTNVAIVGGDEVCRICKQIGHFARECPQKPEGFGKCFNCGEEGHNKAECPNPRVFTGTCRHCQKEGHAARDCPEKPAVVCRNCKEEGHITSECKNNKVFDLSDVESLSIEDAWSKLIAAGRKAVENRDFDDFREAVQVYHKAVPEITYKELERALRTNDIGIYLIATARETYDGYTDLGKPGSAKLAEGWPSSDEENLERLKDAGVPMDRGIPKCVRCKEMGHIAKSCPEELGEIERTVVKCVNCDERKAIWPKSVRNHATRRIAHAEIATSRVKCNNCGQMGHTVKRCTQVAATDDSGFEDDSGGVGITDNAAGNNGEQWGTGAAGGDAFGGASNQWGNAAGGDTFEGTSNQWVNATGTETEVAAW